MNIRITTRSPKGMEANPLMHYIYLHAVKLRELGLRSPLQNLREVSAYLRNASKSWNRANGLLATSSPLVILYREPECCGQEVVIQQGDYNITIKPAPNEKHQIKDEGS
jgi:hypothetical protein